MSEYILLFRGGDSKSLQKSPEKWQAHMQKWMEWMAALQKDGKFLAAQPLTETGKFIKGNKKVVTDSPFMEGKEMVGGYLMCRADSYEEAVSIANGCPILESDDGIVEVREIKELKM